MSLSSGCGVRRLLLSVLRPFRLSRGRRESNRWLLQAAAGVRGKVLSIGSGDDLDGEGRRYRDYFLHAESYTTSEISPQAGCDLVLDVRCMREISDESFDCIFCSGVLEHVDDVHAARGELARVVKRGGTLLLGLPFRQALHCLPHDYWRFTEHGARYFLKDDFEVLELTAVDNRPGFPAAYWIKAVRR